MSTYEFFATLGLRADEFFRGIERATQRAAEFGESFDRMAKRVDAAAIGMAERVESVNGALESMAAIGDYLSGTARPAASTLSEVADGLDEVSEKGFNLQDSLKDGWGLVKFVGGIGSTLYNVEKFGKYVSKAVDKVGEWASGVAKFFSESGIGAYFGEFGAKLNRVKEGFTGLVQYMDIGGKIKAVGAFFEGITLKIKAKWKALEGATIAQKLFNLVMKANPIGLIIAAVAALVAGFIALFKTNEEFREKVIAAWEALRDGVSNILGAVVNFFTVTLPGAFQKALDFVSDKWQGLIVLITKPIDKALYLLGKALPMFIDWARGVIDGIRDKFLSITDIGRDIVVGLVNGVREKIEWAKEVIAEFFGGITSRIRGLFGINSPSRVFASIGESLGEGLVEGVESKYSKAEKSMKDMTDMMTKAAEGAEIVPRVDVERSLAYQIKMFAETYDEVKRIIITAFEAISRKAQEIIRRMSINIDMFLRTSGFQTGRNFFGALGDGLIAEEGRLMSEAMRVADAIREIFEQRQIAASAWGAGVDSFGDIYPLRSGLGVREDYMIGGHTINQHFNIVKEKETGFQAYRAAQKALAMDMDRRRY